jgi:membrane protein implicated in regulation of membrane protease activity
MIQQFSSQPHILWLTIGLIGLTLGMLVGEPSIISLAIAALITAVVALSVESVALQVLVWGVLALCLAFVLRGLEPRESKELLPPDNAEVYEAIPPGGVGYVSYNGSTWRARCQVSDVAIAPGTSVFVVGRQGNTLIVLPAPFPQDLPR